MTERSSSVVDAGQVVRRYVECFADGDVEGWLAQFDDDADVIDPVPGPRLQGRAELRRFISTAMESFRGLDFAVVDVIVGEERDAVMLFRMSRLDRPDLVAYGSSVFRFSPAGQISTLRGYWVPGNLGW
jgi:ketosteroid isomerase-like protein